MQNRKPVLDLLAKQAGLDLYRHICSISGRQISVFVLFIFVNGQNMCDTNFFILRSSHTTYVLMRDCPPS